MSKMRVFLSVLGTLILSAGAWAQTGNRAFLFPSGGNANVTVVDATTLANLGAVSASPNAFRAVSTPDGTKHYIVANNAVNTLTVVNGATLAVIRRVNLGANASAAAVSPDGRRLLIAAGTLRIYDTATDNELANIGVGGGPTHIVITNDSARAYVLSSASGIISAINLANNSIFNQIAISAPLSMALQPDDSRLAVLTSNLVTVYSTFNHTVLTTVPLTNVPQGELLVTPDGSKFIVLNQGVAPSNISRIIDITTATATPIGPGEIGFEQMVVADNATAYGLVLGANRVARIDLSTAEATVQTAFGQNLRAIAISPSGRILYATSFAGSSVARIDLPSGLVTATANVAVGPTGVSVSFPPPTTGGAAIVLNGGDRQSTVAGQTLPVPLSVRITAADGSPVMSFPVTFASAATGVTITPSQPSLTNSRGIAQAVVKVPVAPAELRGEALSEGLGPVNQGIETITVTATASGLGAITFTITVGSGTGIIKISGDFQIARPNQPFPLPLVVRVTDEAGFPVPTGTLICFQVGTVAVFPPSQQIATDIDGLARAQFTGGTPPPGFTSFQANVFAAGCTPGQVVGQTFFTLQTAFSTPGTPEVEGGDNQSGDVGTTLPIPLSARLPQVGFSPLALIGVYWAVISGPAGTGSAILNPSFSITDGGGVARTAVTIGPRAGIEPIVIRASVPGISGFAEFKLRATGGPPERVQILQGDNQSGRPGFTLPQALRVRVLDLFGNSVPLPNSQFPLTFTVSPPEAASLSNFFQQNDGEASVLVTLGNRAGAFTVTAASGNGRAVFNLRVLAVASALVLVSGSGQRVAVSSTAAEPLIARVNDALGNPVAGQAVTFTGPGAVTFIPTQGALGNPVTINTGSDGRASVTVRLSSVAPLGPLTITASSSVGSVSYTLTVVGRAPAFTSGSVLNAASFRFGMVPGGLASLFGAGLSEISGRELPGGATTHRGVSLTVSGRLAPLFFIRNESGQEQINFQVPTDIAPGTARVEVNNNGSIAGVDGVQVLRVQPGIFEYEVAGVKHAVAVKLDSSVIGPNNPAARGSIVLLFLTALGPTAPALSTGQVGPVPPAVTSSLAVVGLNNRGVEVLFSGLTPGFIGLNQINILIPEDAPTGTVNLDVVIDGAASQTSRIVIQ